MPCIGLQVSALLYVCMSFFERHIFGHIQLVQSQLGDMSYGS